MTFEIRLQYMKDKPHSRASFIFDAYHNQFAMLGGKTFGTHYFHGVGKFEEPLTTILSNGWIIKSDIEKYD